MKKILSDMESRFVAATAVMTVAAGFTSYVVTSLMMETALDRKMPGLLKKAGDRIAGSSDIDRDFIRELDLKADELGKVKTKRVEITAEDGIKLVGHWSPVPKAKRTIIAMHGWRSSWQKDFGMVAGCWRENGCNVLFAEQRGQGESGGDCMGFGVTERFDCRDWVNWAVSECGEKLPIYLAGVSMGATTVLMASGLELPDCVHGIIADCGFTSPDEIWKHIANDNLHLPYGVNRLIANALYERKVQAGSDSYSTVDALKNNRIPVLFVHGSDDHFVPVKMTFENYEACRAPKRLLIVPGADHGMSYFREPGVYERAAAQFWKDFDGYVPKIRA